MPLRLSGGERQRVALGRALLSQPKLLLMDEPLSALDRFTKEDIVPYLERIHASLAIPVLYVSHDVSEVERLADHIVLIDRGQVVASGSLRDIQSNPGSALARLPDAAVSLDCEILDQDANYGLTKLAVNGATLLVPAVKAAIGERRRAVISASDVSLALSAAGCSTILNCLEGRILSAERDGTYQINVAIGLGADGTGDRILAPHYPHVLGRTRTNRGRPYCGADQDHCFEMICRSEGSIFVTRAPILPYYGKGATKIAYSIFAVTPPVTRYVAGERQPIRIQPRRPLPATSFLVRNILPSITKWVAGGPIGV